jgi:hypothetical protein
MSVTPPTLLGFLTRTAQALLIQDLIGAMVEPLFVRILSVLGKADVHTSRRRLALALFRFAISFLLVWAIAATFGISPTPIPTV